jgi:putative ABC transport system permease protein
MIFADLLALVPLAARNLMRRNRRRTCLTVLTVAAATVVYCAVMVVPYVTMRIADLAEESPRLVVVNRASIRYALPESYYDKIVRVPGVVAVNKMTWFVGVYDDPKHQFPTMALDANNFDVVWPEYRADARTISAFKSAKDAALVGVATMERFGWRVGQNVALRSEIYPVTLTFRIAGVYDKGPDLRAFMFHREYLDEALHNSGRVDFFWVRCSGMDTTGRVAAAIDEMFRNSGAETESRTEKAFMTDLLSRFKSITAIVEGIGLVSVIALALAVLNAASMSLRERRSELAVLRSMGFVGDQILASIGVEAVLMAAAGGILGTMMAYEGLFLARGSVPTLGPLLSFGLPGMVMAEGIAAALAMGLFAAVAPGVAALRSSVAETLRRI